MKFTIAGESNKKTVLLLPGTCCNIKFNFSKVWDLLSQKYQVIGVDYDGFDGSNEDFTNMLDVTKKIEDFIIKNYDGKVDVAYGSSLGGSFVGLLIQRKRIHINHGIIGSSDLDQAGKLVATIETKMIGNAFYGILKKGTMPKWMIWLMNKKMGKDVTDQLLETMSEMSESAKGITKKSMCNQFYSDLITPLEEKINVQGTMVHIFYALQMGEKYRQRYLKHFYNPDIIEQNYGHEELLFFYPEKWLEEFDKCVNK